MIIPKAVIKSGSPLSHFEKERLRRGPLAPKDANGKIHKVKKVALPEKKTRLLKRAKAAWAEVEEQQALPSSQPTSTAAPTLAQVELTSPPEPELPPSGPLDGSPEAVIFRKYMRSICLAWSETGTLKHISASSIDTASKEQLWKHLTPHHRKLVFELGDMYRRADRIDMDAIFPEAEYKKRKTQMRLFAVEKRPVKLMAEVERLRGFVEKIGDERKGLREEYNGWLVANGIVGTRWLFKSGKLSWENMQGLRNHAAAHADVGTVDVMAGASNVHRKRSAEQFSDEDVSHLEFKEAAASRSKMQKSNQGTPVNTGKAEKVAEVESPESAVVSSPQLPTQTPKSNPKSVAQKRLFTKKLQLSASKLPQKHRALHALLERPSASSKLQSVETSSLTPPAFPRPRSRRISMTGMLIPMNHHLQP